MERNEIDNIADQGESVMAAFCENAQLFGAAPGSDEFDSRDVWDEDDALGRGARCVRDPRGRHRPRRHTARRRTREPALGLRQHARRFICQSARVAREWTKAL